MAGPTINAKCPHCRYALVLGSANTTLIWTRQHEYMSYLHVECPRPQCSHEWFMFLDAENPQEARRLLKLIQHSEWSVQVKTPTPDHVIGDYEEMAGITLAEPIELTHRLEEAVKALEWELRDATVQDILDVDIENRLPRNWV